MPPAPPTLNASVAGLRASVAALPAPIWLPDAVHALILACFARIFARLEDMIALWQAGILPPPPPTRAPIPHRQATTRIVPPRPSFLAWLASYFATQPEPAPRAGRTPMPAPIDPATAHPEARIVAPAAIIAADRASSAGKKASGHKDTKTRRSKAREKNVHSLTPSYALALPCSFVSSCLRGRFLPSPPIRAAKPRHFARAPPRPRPKQPRTRNTPPTP